MAQNKSVLFVTMNSITGRGGDTMATNDILSTFINDDRVSTAAVIPDPQGPLPFNIDNSRVYRFRPLSKKSPAAYFRYSFSPIKTVRRALDEYDPDIVVIRDYPLGVFPSLLSVLDGTPYILLARGTYDDLKYSRILKQSYKINARFAREVYTASQEIKQDTDRIRKKNQSKAKLVPNGINPEKFVPKSKSEMREKLDLDFDETDFVVGFVGSMGPRHSLDTLIKALEQVDDLPVRLLLVGDGPELANHKELVQQKDLSDKVEFTGFVPHDTVDRYISACDITYGVTQQDSATPIKCFEYLACERPLIVRDIPEMKFVSEENVGVQVTGIQEDNIAKAIRQLYNMDDQTRIQMGKVGRKYVLENHTWNIFVDEVVKDLMKPR